MYCKLPIDVGPHALTQPCIYLHSIWATLPRLLANCFGNKFIEKRVYENYLRKSYLFIFIYSEDGTRKYK